MGIYPQVERIFPAPDLDAPVASHCGSPGQEARALLEGRALVDLSHFSLVEVRGVGAAKWLTSLTSQLLTGMRQGESREALILDPAGHIEFALGVLCLKKNVREEGEAAGEAPDGFLGSRRRKVFLEPENDQEYDLLLISEAGTGEELVKYLQALRFGARVQVSEVSAKYAVLGSVYRPDSELSSRLYQLLEQVGGGQTWLDPWPVLVPGGADYSVFAAPVSPATPATLASPATPASPAENLPAAAKVLASSPASPASPGVHPGLDTRFALSILPRENYKNVAQEVLGREPGTLAGAGARRWAGIMAWEAARIAAWRPRLGREADPKALPGEFDWLRSAVHLSKGCYCGQETVAKIHNLGVAPRRLVLLEFESSDGGEVELPAPGTSFESVLVTSVGVHPDLGPIGLGLVKRSFSDKILQLGGLRAVVTPIVWREVAARPTGFGPAKRGKRPSLLSGK